MIVAVERRMDVEMKGVNLTDALASELYDV
jgi:hypothetical protein